MKAVKTNNGRAIFLDESEFLALGFICVNLLGRTGIQFLDEHSQKVVPTVLSGFQMCVLERLLESIQRSQNDV